MAEDVLAQAREQVTSLIDIALTDLDVPLPDVWGEFLEAWSTGDLARLDVQEKINLQLRPWVRRLTHDNPISSKEYRSAHAVFWIVASAMDYFYRETRSDDHPTIIADEGMAYFQAAVNQVFYHLERLSAL